MSDTQVLSVAQKLLDCLRSAVEANPNIPSHISFRIGDQVSHDYGPTVDECCEGLAYVSMGTIIPSAASPTADVERQASSKCSPPSWVVTLKAGIVRCAPSGQDDGDPPTDVEWTDAFIQSVDDASALRKAACCFRSCIIGSDDFNLLGMSVVIGSQEQGPVSGGCMERFFGVQFQIPNLDCCPCSGC